MIDDRNYIGYGANPPDPQWPGGARIAVNINLNFEGGGERSIMDGDGVSEGALNDIGARSLSGLRSPLVESVFEYGSRVGGWRLLRLFHKFGVKVCLRISKTGVSESRLGGELEAWGLGCAGSKGGSDRRPTDAPAGNRFPPELLQRKKVLTPPEQGPIYHSLCGAQ